MANKFFVLRQQVDDFLLEAANMVMRVDFFISGLLGKKAHMKRNLELKDSLLGKRGVVVANGPSIKKQNLRLLKDEITVFVNRSYLHPDYEYIKPTFHVFIDNKMKTGEWSIDYINQVVKKNPDVILLLNEQWAKEEKFKKFVTDQKYKIFWIDTRLFTTPFFKKDIDLTKVTYGGAVTGAAFSTLIYCGINEIFFTGNDGNGLCYELINQDSHFYGTNNENKLKSIYDIYYDLSSMSMSLKNWVNFSTSVEKKGVKVYNCSHEGIFNMFKRVDFNSTFSK